MFIAEVFLNLLVYIIPVISCIYIIVGIRLLKHRAKGSVNYFSLLMFASAIYSFGYFLELNSVTYDTFLVFRNFECIGAAFFPTFGFLFIAGLTKTKISGRVKGILFAVSTILCLVYITNPLHYLFYKSITLRVVSGFEVAASVKGPLFYILISYYAIFMIFSNIMLLNAHKKAKRWNQIRSFRFLFITFQFPWVTILVTILGFDANVDLAPLTIMILCILFSINEIMNDMFELFELEIQRWKSTFSNIGEVAFLVNEIGEAVCTNVNASAFISASKKSMKDIIDNLDYAELNGKSVVMSIDHVERWFDVKKTNFDTKKRFTNYLLMDITKRKQAENAFVESEKEHRLLITQMEQGIAVYEVIVDETGEVVDYRFLDVNKSFELMTGLERDEIIGKTVLELMPGVEGYMNEKNSQVAMTGEPNHYEYYAKEPGKYFEAVAYSPQPKQVAVIMSDITVSKRLETALFNEKTLVKTTLESIGDGVISTDNKGNIVFVNKVAQSLTGWTQEDACGKAIEEVFHTVNESTQKRSDSIVKKVLESKKILELSNHTILISKDGMQHPIEDSAAPIFKENEEITGVVLVFRDFSEKKQKQEEILNLSYHDYLTGLYNRRFYEEELKRLDTKRNLPLSLVMGDVNGLKLINDSFGHQMGDQLIQKAADMIRSGSRVDDIIARIGGDEFIIILPKTGSNEAEEIIKRMKEQTSENKEDTVDVSISFGYKTKEYEEENIQEIFKKAEDDMYRHKLYESAETKSKTISLILDTLYEKSPQELLHSKRVSELCKETAVQMNFGKDAADQIEIAGLMHDIGKMGIDKETLQESTKLTPEEWIEMKRHPEIGYRILNGASEYVEMAEYILEHHERWDGKGYPKGLKGEEISVQARIISVVEAYDVMTNYRTSGKAVSQEKAINEIRACSGTQFDPEIAKIFVEKVMGKVW